MDFLQLAEVRYSVRSYDPKPVEDEKINMILKAAQFAPTACNYQPQRIYVIRSPEALEKIKACSPCMYGAPLAFLICADKKVAWHKHTFQKDVPESQNSAEMDASIVATHMMLEAYNIGIGSVWVGAFEKEKATELFQIPENVEPFILLPMGYPSDKAKQAPLHNNKKDFSTFTTFC